MESIGVNSLGSAAAFPIVVDCSVTKPRRALLTEQFSLESTFERAQKRQFVLKEIYQISSRLFGRRFANSADRPAV